METASVHVNGIELVYDAVGSGPPIVLLHGFASNRRDTWNSIRDVLAADGRRVLALDIRGHGDSEKPHESSAYEPSVLSRDVTGFLEALSIQQTDLLGYSMGARIAMQVLADDPERINTAILAGVGERTLRETRYNDSIAAALAADNPDTIEDETAKQFRHFAAERGNDLTALAAFRRAPQVGLVLDRQDLAAIETPVLVAAGSNDVLVGSPDPLAAAFQNATAAVIPDCDHLETVDSSAFESAILAYLAQYGL